MELQGKHVLVTGASKGIGAAIAKELLSNGATVSLHYHSDLQGAQALAQDYPPLQASVFGADFEDMEAVKQLFTKVVEQSGRLDTLVLNAGVFLPHGKDLDIDPWWKVWRRTLAVNLDACGMLTKLALDHFVKQGGGRLLYIGSRAAFRGETEEYIGYAASKGALTAMARTVARSYGTYGIKAFVIAPGFTRTPMADAFIREKGEAFMQKEIALDRLTRPEDIAPLAAFICSGKMDHATGTTIDINAGSYMH